METISTKRKRIYQRKFDHEQAQELWAKGFNANEIARQLGHVVTPAAITRVCDPLIRKRMDEATRRYVMSGTCTECGGPCHKYTSKENDPFLCMKCSREKKQTRFRLDDEGTVISIRCGKCKSWKDPILFREEKKYSRGIAQRCRQCETIARQDYRQRRKIPCVICGKPALPKEEKGPRSAPYPRCVECFRLGKILLPDV